MRTGKHSQPPVPTPTQRKQPRMRDRKLAPRPFGKYELLHSLGTNGIAEVWLARLSDGSPFARNLALKLFATHLSRDSEFVHALEQEALSAARLNHPNIALIQDFGQTDGTCYLATEYVHGGALSQVLHSAEGVGRWVPRHLAFRIAASVCEGLYHAHTRQDGAGQPLGVVHRDICPENILISREGTVKLVDFGISRALSRSTSDAAAIFSRFAYMAPEQAAGQSLDHRTDVFSLGLVLYELLTGVQPFKRGSELATLQAALECQLAPPSKVADVPPELDDVVMGALARSPANRYRDARQFLQQLEQVIVGQGWVAGSLQLSDMMEELYPEALTQG